jgi:diacylglycerol O-acyltransferase/trehalose O-mycolyltransferase
MRVAALLALALSALPSAARAACDPPRCRELVVPVPHGLRVPDSRVRVLLPVGYDGGHARYPVLYLLHGAGDTSAAWTDRTDVADFTATIPPIVVMPDGGHDANAGFYSDWIDGSRQWETFHARRSWT